MLVAHCTNSRIKLIKMSHNNIIIIYLQTNDDMSHLDKVPERENAHRCRIVKT